MYAVFAIVSYARKNIVYMHYPLNCIKSITDLYHYIKINSLTISITSKLYFCSKNYFEQPRKIEKV